MSADPISPTGTKAPLVFIIHDPRDSALAQTFRDLLKDSKIRSLSASQGPSGAGHSCEKFGPDWYQGLVNNIAIATHVVCLVTTRFTDSPDVLFEVGVERATRSEELISLSLGGESRELMNSPLRASHLFKSDAESLTALIRKLLGLTSGFEPSAGSIGQAVKNFRARIGGVGAQPLATSSLTAAARKRKAQALEQASVKLIHELKDMLRDI